VVLAHDAWRFRSSVPSLAYPEGANIIFTDSIPLLAAVFKVVRHGVEVNYFGLWMATCYVMRSRRGTAAARSASARARRTLRRPGRVVRADSPRTIRHGALCAHFSSSWR
jgi:hypothetical protein